MTRRCLLYQHSLLVIAIGVTACAPAARSGTDRGEPLEAPASDARSRARPAADLSGSWATGTTSEPTVRQIELRPPCLWNPAQWIIEQQGDSLRAWAIPQSQSQGVASRVTASNVGESGRIDGVDVRIGQGNSGYALRYDSTSGHLRGTHAGAPFWAVRQNIIRPQGCLPPP